MSAIGRLATPSNTVTTLCVRTDIIVVPGVYPLRTPTNYHQHVNLERLGSINQASTFRRLTTVGGSL